MNRIVLIGTLLIVFFLQASAQTGIPFSVEKTGQNSWRITVQNTAPYIGLYDADSVASIVKMSGHSPYTVPGGVTLPLKRFWLPVPSGAALQARIVSINERSENVQLITTPDDPFTEPRPRNTVAGSRGYVSVGGVRTLEGVRKQSLDLVSAHYNQTAHAVRWVESVEIDVTLTETSMAAPLLADLDDVQQQVAMYNTDTDAYLQWFTPGDRMLKILTPEEGVYRITYQEAAAAQVPVASIDPETFQLFLDGHEQAIIVRNAAPGVFQEGDVIEFYAPRRSGIGSEYYDEWSDDNVFWLSWGGAPGKRVQMESAAPSGATTLATIPVVRHFEEDLTYHRGDSDEFDGTFTDKRPGETWVWRYIIKDSSYTINFNLPDVAETPAYIITRMKKSSASESLIRMTINGTEVKEFVVGNWFHGAALPMQDTTALLASVLRPGNNTITYHSIGDTLNHIKRVYLDFFEVYYQSNGSADENVIRLNTDAYRMGPHPPQKFVANIDGFSTERIRAVNAATGDTLGGFTQNIVQNARQAAFEVPSSQSYYIFNERSIKTPSSMTLQTMTDYGSPNNAADYIIVAHPLFMASAQRLANYRESKDGYRTVVANVNDLYNEFNHGHKDPSAIKRFAMKAYEVWEKPAPAFFTIIGDASWDPKHLHPTAVKEDYVPAFGNPVSDTYYISVDSTDVYPLMTIGRIPCETNDAAEAVIEKVVAYEAALPADWHNRFLITSGGVDYGEFNIFRTINEGFITQFLEPNCLEYHRIYKKDPSLVGYEDIDSIVTNVNKGVLWFNFVGHGGSRIIDIGIERPDIFDVQGKYPLFSTLSCNTAHYAEPHETGLNEKFAMAAANGAIASIGTSGLGFLSRDRILGDEMFDAIATGNAKTFGEVLTLGKLGLLLQVDPVGDQISRNTALQVTYLGDPATRIPLEKMPELAIEEENLATDPEILVQGTQVMFTTEFQNFGFCMDDTVTARFRILDNGSEFFADEQSIPPFAEAYSVEWPVSLGSLSGLVTIEVTIDTENLLTERTKVNNKLVIERNVLRRGVTPVFPHNNSVVSLVNTEQTFVVANPSIVPLEADDVTIELQISTDPDFSQSVTQLSHDIGTVFTWFEDIDDIKNEGVYYWRGRMVVDGTPEDWSPAWSFTAQQNAKDERFLQTQYEQLKTASLDATELHQDGSVTLGTTDVRINVFSAANNQGDVDNLAQILVNGVDYAANARGFNAAVINPRNGAVVQQALFDTYSGPDEVTRMIAFLRNLPDDYYLALAVHDDVNGWWGASKDHSNLTPEFQQELQKFGSTLFDQGYPDVWWHVSYAMFGRKSEPERTREYINSYGAALFGDTISVQAVTGTLRSALAGPANTWDTFSWQGQVLAESSKVDLTVYSGMTEQDSVLYQLSEIAPQQEVSLAALSTTNPFAYFELTLRDTSTVSSPVIDGWSVAFTSEYPELGITNQVVESDPDSVLEGNPITLNVQVYNAGRTDAVNVPVYIRTPGTQGQNPAPVIIPSIPAGKDEYEEFEYDISTAGLRGNWNADIAVAEGKQYPEYYKGNNLFSERFASGKDNIRPDLNVLFDGMPIVDLDYVSPTPVIEITLIDNSPLPVTDTSSMQLFLDGRRIWLNANPQLTYALGGTGEDKFEITYTPELRPGIRTLSITGKDADGNAVDSIPYQVRFQVKTENLVDQIYPVPNPSQGQMNYSFRVIGSTPPESGTIKIYTVAGRLIREIEIHRSDLRIGLNRIPWDGRDHDGDLLANGVYLYKLTLRRNDANQEFLGKVAILR